jgi:hypothetical protein
MVQGFVFAIMEQRDNPIGQDRYESSLSNPEDWLRVYPKGSFLWYGCDTLPTRCVTNDCFGDENFGSRIERPRSQEYFERRWKFYVVIIIIDVGAGNDATRLDWIFT